MEQEITTVQEYLMAILPYQQRALAQIHRFGSDRPALLFRGQKKDKPLVAKIAQVIYNNECHISQPIAFERNRLRIIQSIVNTNGDYSEWDIIALAQHYGIETRFLDWTSNSLIALWFALNSVNSHSEGQPTVWILETDKHDFDIPDGEQSPIPGEKGSETVIFTPRLIDSRILAQDSYLMRQVYEHTDPDNYKVMSIRSVNENPAFKYRCHCVTISNNKQHKELMCNELEKYGYTRNTIIPFSIWSIVKERCNEIVKDYAVAKTNQKQ